MNVRIWRWDPGEGLHGKPHSTGGVEPRSQSWRDLTADFSDFAVVAAFGPRPLRPRFDSSGHGGQMTVPPFVDTSRTASL
jgi:hypothetical protein